MYPLNYINRRKFKRNITTQDPVFCQNSNEINMLELDQPILARQFGKKVYVEGKLVYGPMKSRWKMVRN